MKRILLLLILFLIFASCRNNREIRRELVRDKTEVLSDDLDEWNKLTLEILNDRYVNSRLGYSVRSLDLNEKLKQKLQEKGIGEIKVRKNQTCNEVEYVTSWADYPIGTLYLTWTTCDSYQTKKGYYLDNFNTNFIEVWGNRK